MLKNLLTILNIAESLARTASIDIILEETAAFRTNILWRRRIEEVKDQITPISIDVVFYYLTSDKNQDLKNLEILNRLFERSLIIIITQDDDTDIFTETFSMGCQDILDKNKVTEEILISSIRKSIERKKREYEFRRCNEQSKLIFSTMGEGIIWTDREDRILFINKRVSEIYGYAEKELIGQIAYNILEHPDDRGLIIEQNKSRLKGITDSYEIRGLKKTGETIWVKIHGSPVYNSDNMVIGSVGVVSDITEMKEVEKKLKISESHYRRFVEEDLTGDYITTPDGKILYCNNSLVKILRMKSREELINKNAHEFYTDVRDRTHFLNEIKSKKRISNLESQLISGDGTLITVVENVSGVFDKNDNLIQIIGYMFDITERKELEKQLHDQTYLLSNVIRFLPIGLFIIDSTGKIIHANPSCQEIWAGVKYVAIKDYVQYKGWWVDTGNLIKAEEWAAARAITNKEISLNEEIEIECFDGTHKIILNSAIPILKSNGEILAAIAINIDISERKRSEEVILKLNRAIEQSSACIVITDAEGIFEYVNPYFTRLTGYKLDELKDKTPRILKSGLQDDNFYKYLWDTILSGKVWEGEMQNKKKDGELYWASAVISPVVGKDGKVTHFVGIEEDISQRKKLLKEIIDAKEKAVISDKLKTEFLAQMSHEIRTPLNIIASNAEILKDEFGHLIPTEYDDVFASIELASQRIIRTINLILNSAELQTGIFKFNSKEIDLNLQLQKLIKEHRLLSEVKGLDLTLVLNAEDSKINGDEYAISQIFANLIDNAIKYTKRGKIIVKIDRNMKGEIYVSVQDTGIGISENFQKRLFESFSQEEQGYNRTYDGNGLGLSLVKKYCEYNNATIDVKSKKGVGTTFIITFHHAFYD